MSEACERCAQPLGAPHTALPSDCVMGHPDHTEQFIGYLCRRHYGWISATLAQIEELFALLPEVLIPGPAGDGRGGTRVGSPAPGSVTVMALTDPRGLRDWIDDPEAIPDVPGALDAWIRVMAEEWPGVRLDDYTGQLCSAVRVLNRERRWLASQPWVDDYANELAALHRAVARGVGDSMWPLPIGKCPYCQRPLYPTIGVDEVTCSRCKVTWRGVALMRLRLIHEQEGSKKPAPAKIDPTQEAG